MSTPRVGVAVAAWSAAALAVAGAAYAVLLAPGGDLPWKAVLLPALLGLPGALIAVRLPAHPAGWLMLGQAVCFAGSALGTQWLAAGRETAAAWAAWFPERAAAVVVPGMLALLLVLPDGRLPSRRWRPLAVGAVGAQLLLVLLWAVVRGPVAAPDSTTPRAAELLNPVGLLPASWGPVLAGLEWMLVVPLLLGIAAVVQRIRSPVEDQRPRVVSVLAAVVVFVVLDVVARLVWPAAGDWFDVLGAAVLAGAVLAAVLRGRFERVQVVVSHALVYAVLTGAIALAYTGLVALAPRAGVPASATGLLTAVVALVLLPARGVLQRGLRRAMYGDRGAPHVALRRLSSSVAGADDLAGVLAGLARSIRSSLRARGVTVTFRGVSASVGTPDGVSEERTLDGGSGASGRVQVTLPPGRRLATDEAELLDDLVAHGARAARMVCLADELARARLTLVAGREEERSRLRRDLHDELGPTLAGLAMQLGSLPEVLREDADLAADRLAHLERAARTALDRMRDISRGLRPPALDELGLVPALVESGRALGLQVSVCGAPPALPPAAEVAVYRIVAEALVNTHRHAGVATVALEFGGTADDLEVAVVDRGAGRAGAPAGVGLVSMRERAAELGGSLSVVETDGGGTTVRLSLPLRPIGAGP